MRRALKWLLALLAVPAVLLLAVAVAAWWLVGTQAGLRWALDEAVSRSGGRLEVREPAGALVRSFSLRELVFRNDATTVRAKDVSAGLDLLALSTGILRVENLQAGQVDVTLQEKEPREEQPPPSRLGLPLEVRIEQAHVGRLEVRRGEAVYPVTDLRFSYAGDATVHELAELTAQTQWGHVALGASMAATPPFRVEARGTLTRPHATAQAYVRALPFATEKLEALQVTAENVDLARLDAALPRTLLTLRVEGEATRDAAFAGVVRLANGDAGPLDRDRLPVVALDARVALRGSTVHIDALDAAAAGGSVTGSGTAQRDGGKLQLDVRNIDLRAVRSSLRRTALSGVVRIAATPDRQSIAGTVAQEDMRLTADAVRSGDLVEVRSFEATASGGRASGSGSVRLGDPLRFHARVALAGFDPSRFGEYPEGSVNGRAEVSGALGQPLRVDASWSIAESTLAGRPFASEGRGGLSGERVAALEATASWGDNRASARGALGASGDELAWTLEAPDLPQDFLDARIEASGTARGSWRNPNVSFQARAAPAVLAGRVRVDALSARGDGTLESHVLRLASDGEGFDAHAELRGGWSTEHGWRGTLERLDNAGRYPLQLEAPVPLRLSPQAIDVGELRARLGAGYLRVSALEWEPGRLATRGEFAGLPARWAIVAAGLHDALRSTLLLDGRWDFASLQPLGQDTPVLKGRAQVRRASGDLEVLEPSPLALGLSAAALDARFEEGRIAATLDIDSALGEAHAKGTAGGWTSDSAVDFEARLAVADIRALVGGLPPELRLTGRAAATIRGRGTLAAPELAGTLTADGLSVHVPPYGVYLEDGALRASLQGDALQVERFTLRGGKGELTAEGRLPFGKGAAGADLRWSALQLEVLSRPDMRLVVSGAGAAMLEDRRVALQGKLQVENGYVERGFEQLPTLGDDVVVVSGPLEKESREGAGRRVPLDLAVSVDLGQNFKVRMEGFDGLLRGEVRVSTDAQGTLRANGRIRAADATFRAYGRTLNVDPGEVIFDGPPDNPSLQIEAWRRNQEVAAGVRITGTLEQPRVELVSDPPLPEGAKLSWLVLGHPPSEATGGDVALLQTAASALLGRGNSVPLTTRLADQLGVDELSLRGSAELENRVVAVGKRLSDRIYVTYEQGVGVAQNLVKVDLSLTERISLRGQTGSTSGAGIFYRYSWD